MGQQACLWLALPPPVVQPAPRSHLSRHLALVAPQVVVPCASSVTPAPLRAARAAAARQPPSPASWGTGHQHLLRGRLQGEAAVGVTLGPETARGVELGDDPHWPAGAAVGRSLPGGAGHGWGQTEVSLQHIPAFWYRHLARQDSAPCVSPIVLAAVRILALIPFFSFLMNPFLLN